MAFRPHLPLLALSLAMAPVARAQGPAAFRPTLAGLRWSPIPDAAPAPAPHRSLGSSVLRGTVIGGFVGIAAGALVGAAFHDGYSCSDGGFCMTAGGGAVLGAGVGMVAGAIGGLIFHHPAASAADAVSPEGMLAGPGSDGTVLVGISLRR